MSPAPTPEGEFYIGWAPMPPRHRRFVRRVVIATGVTLCLVAAALVSGLRHEARATFDYGKPRLWRGRVTLDPAPLLWSDDGRPFYLVAQGKHGADALLGAFDGDDVELRAALFERGGLRGPQRMLEIVSVRRLPAASSAAPPPAPRTLGHVRWRGEIADGKCYLGVMVPGEGKTHRDCAARCISGGTPPMLALSDGNGGSAAVLLADGKRLDGTHRDSGADAFGARLAPFVGEPVWVEGDLAAYGDLMVLAIDPDRGVTRDDE